jgi:hypothetical protein
LLARARSELSPVLLERILCDYCQGYGATRLRVVARDPIGKQDSSSRDSSP